MYHFLVGTFRNVWNGTQETTMCNAVPYNCHDMCLLVIVCAHGSYVRRSRAWTIGMAILDKTHCCRYWLYWRWRFYVHTMQVVFYALPKMESI